MAVKKIEIDTVDCGTKKLIEVDEKIVSGKKLDDYIEFQNKLDNDVTANLTFYKLTEKDQTGKEITGFCTENAGKKTLDIVGSGSGKQDCHFAQAVGTYAYTIEATAHEELDPIIIIEPQRLTTTTTKSLASNYYVFGAAIVAVALVAYWLGTKRRSGAS